MEYSYDNDMQNTDDEYESYQISNKRPLVTQSFTNYEDRRQRMGENDDSDIIVDVTLARKRQQAFKNMTAQQIRQGNNIQDANMYNYMLQHSSYYSIQRRDQYIKMMKEKYKTHFDNYKSELKSKTGTYIVE